MSVYTAKDLHKLAEKIKGKDAIVNRALKLVVNKGATFGKKESVDMITKRVNLKPSYVNRGLRVVKRASVADLTAIVRGNVRGTLLQRYPHSFNSSGVTVRVNRTGAALTIKGARMVNLRGSGEKVIGVFNKDAVEIFTKALNKGKGITPAKRAKLYNIERRAAKAPYGRTPLHSRSINQLFESVKEDVQPSLIRFMRNEFLLDFTRLDK